MLRHNLPIITPDLPIPTRRQNSSVKPELLNPKFSYKTEKSSRVLTAERIFFGPKWTNSTCPAHATGSSPQLNFSWNQPLRANLSRVVVANTWQGPILPLEGHRAAHLGHFAPRVAPKRAHRKFPV